MKDRTIDLALRDKTNKEFKFDSFKHLERFVAEEHQVWSTLKNQLSGNTGHIGHYSNAASYFNQIISHLENFKANLDSWDDSTLQQQIQQHISRNLANLTQHWIWSGHPFCRAWLDVFDKYGHEVAHSFVEAFLGNRQFSGLSKIEHLTGAVLAYEFQLQDESTLTKRRNTERKSVSQVRNSLVEAQKQLFEDVHQFQSDFESWDKETRILTERLYNVRKRLGERQLKQQINRFDSQMSDWQQKIEHLESTYQEKLRLEKPAAYWNAKAKSYFNHGRNWSILLGSMLVAGIVGIGLLFKSWLIGLDAGVSLNTLQGVILFVTLLSIYAFLIKALSKMAFSSFHLQRDAEEREQLTHVYLALTHEKEDMDIEARNIVLQALFSRADTGLLSGDSGPTMPGLHEIVKATSTK